jgi:hypothetical protein
VVGLSLILGAWAYGRGCDFETMDVCRAFGLWPASAFYVEGIAGLTWLAGMASALLGLALITIAGVVSVGRALIAGGVD